MKKYSNIKSFLGESVAVKIDRPLGSIHPQHGYKYPVNYGFIPETKAPDGEEIDAYVVKVDKPIKEFIGICVAIIHRIDDDDDKLVVIPENTNISDNEIRDLTHFQEQYFNSVIWRKI